MKESTTIVMHAIGTKTLQSKNPLALVPCISSMPEFFFSATSRTRPWMVTGTVKTDIAGKGVILKDQVVPVQALAILNGQSRHHVKNFGLN